MKFNLLAKLRGLGVSCHMMGTRVASGEGIGAVQPLAGGVNKLLEDLARLCDERETADCVFLVGREEIPVHAHRIILMARCRSFQNVKRGEICKIPGSTVTPPAPGSPTPIRLPQYQGETFKHVLIYVYTGKMVLSDSQVFEVLSIAQDLGLDELKMSCEEHLTSTLSVHNACTFLAAAIDMQERTAGGKGSKCFVDRCISYIGENASECVHTTSFLNLPRETLIPLISSDSLALEEEDVWRCVLSWAKYQAGVTQPTPHWTEEERLRVCQHLHGVINHVRLLLIDSKVFAEEVEPTGAVPLELSLERYRAAALPDKYRTEPDNKPRLSVKFFSNTHILMQEKSGLQRVLNQWYGEHKQQWRLVYRASTHGYNADSFHRHCDGISPTYVIIQGAHGDVCGGFSDVPWGRVSGRGRYVPSNRAFLFTLINQGDIPPTKFNVSKKMFAISHHPDFGPIFGAGADLCIASNCNSNLDSYSNLPHSYSGEHASSTILMGDYNFTVQDYEVYTPANK